MSRKSQLSKNKRREGGAFGSVAQVKTKGMSRNDKNGGKQVVTRDTLVQVLQQEMRHYSGPIPQSEEIERYEKICPGYAQALLEMAQKGQNHSIKMDEREAAMQEKFTEQYQSLFARGQIIASIWVVAGMISGTTIALKGYPIQGTAIIVAVLGVMGGVFLWSNWKGK